MRLFSFSFFLTGLFFTCPAYTIKAAGHKLLTIAAIGATVATTPLAHRGAQASKDDPQISPEEAQRLTKELCMRCASGNVGDVSEFLQHPGIDVNRPDAQGMTPLLYACENEHSEVVQVLQQHPGIDINKADKQGYTPIMLAALNKENMRSLSLLCRDLRTDILLCNQDGDTVQDLIFSEEMSFDEGWAGLIFLMCLRKHVAIERKVMPFIVGRWIRLAFSDSDRMPPAIKRCLFKFIPSPYLEEQARLLIQQHHLFFIACKKGDISMVMYFVETLKIDPEKPNIKGDTPLSVALAHGHEAVVELLSQQPTRHYPHVEVSPAGVTSINYYQV